MNRVELKARMINGSQKNCWCPLCEQDGKQAAFFVPWISPVGVLVCVYGACADCSATVQNAPDKLRSGIMDRIEQHLLNKYPELWKKLPSGYSPTSST